MLCTGELSRCKQKTLLKMSSMLLQGMLNSPMFGTKMLTVSAYICVMKNSSDVAVNVIWFFCMPLCTGVSGCKRICEQCVASKYGSAIFQDSMAPFLTCSHSLTLHRRHCIAHTA
jgi:hypothetical protein